MLDGTDRARIRKTGCGQVATRTPNLNLCTEPPNSFHRALANVHVTESGDMQLDDGGPTIEAFKELSLQRDRRAEIRNGRGMPRGKAQGLRGLAKGGRAGIAKRNFAGLAPEFMSQAGPSSSASWTPPVKPVSKLSALAARSSAKRPAENPPPNAGNRPRPASPASAVTESHPAPAPSTASASTPAAGSSRPNKLAALVAARSGASASTPKPAAVPMPDSKGVAVEASSKPLTKLQQRMLANKQQRHAATPEAKEAAAAEAAEEEARSRPQTCYGSELPIASLFPTGEPATAKSSGTSLTATSAIAGSSQDMTDQLVAPLSRVRTVPGGSPFALYVQGSAEGSTPQIELVRKAFAGPSPDDVVLKAREGTRLGAK